MSFDVTKVYRMTWTTSRPWGDLWTTGPPGRHRYGCRMRWDRFFADLEAQAEAADRAVLDADVGGLVRAERATVRLLDRVAAHPGQSLTWWVADGTALTGVLLDAGADWSLVRSGEQVWLLPSTGVVALGGLGRAAVAPDGVGRVARSLRITTVLRGLARDRARVRAHLTGGAVVEGTVDRVGADHLDLALHPADEPRRPSAVTSVRCVPFAALLRVAVG